MEREYYDDDGKWITEKKKLITSKFSNGILIYKSLLKVVLGKKSLKIIYAPVNILKTTQNFDILSLINLHNYDNIFVIVTTQQPIADQLNCPACLIGLWQIHDKSIDFRFVGIIFTRLPLPID